MKIWLAYVNYPITTAVYVRRALQSMGHQVITIGPPLPSEAVDLWHLHNLKVPITPQDIDTSLNPDMAEILRTTPSSEWPDLYLWVESLNGYWPQNLQSLPCPKACWLIDSHVGLERHLEQASCFDYVFTAQLRYRDELRRVNTMSFWLPLACDPGVHRPYNVPLRHDVTFVGNLTAKTRRMALLERLDSAFNLRCERVFLEEMAHTFSESRIIFNNAVCQDLNMRFFEVLSVGTLLLSDQTVESGQSELFKANHDYACYHDSNIIDVVRFYLADEPTRLNVSKRGHQLVRNAHTYSHRMEDLLSVVMQGKRDTWSAGELRIRSLPQDEPRQTETTTPLVIGTPRSAVPLRLRSIVTARAARPHPIIKTAVEWGEEFANCLGIERQDLATPHYTQNQSYADYDVDLLFLTLADDLNMFRYNRQLIPVISDVWERDLPSFAITAAKYPLVYITSLDACKRLNRLGLHQVHWMPFSVASCHLRPQPLKKQFDIIQFGRKNPVFDQYMELLLQRHPAIHYITTTANHETSEYRIISNHLGDLGSGNDRARFMEILHACRISLVSPPGHDGEDSTGGIQVAAIRYFESIAAYCHLIARHRVEREFHFLGIEQLCHHADSYEQFETMVLQLLQKPMDRETVNRYREVQEMHTTRQRAVQVSADLRILAAQ